MNELELNKISFCDKTCYNICNNNFKKDITEKLNNFNIKIPYSKYLNYNNTRHFNFIKNNPYLITCKSVGNIYLLYLTKINGINSCFFIDNKIIDGYQYPRILLIRYRFHNDLFENGGTLFEGELVKTTNDWKFILSDLIVLKGNVQNTPLLKKLIIIKKILIHQYIYDPFIESCILKVKRFFPFDKYSINEFFNYISNLNYKIRNLVFIPAYFDNKYLLFSINNKLNKLPIKPREKLISKTPNKNKMISFIMSKTITPGIYQLYCSKNGFITKHSIARIDGLECINFIKENFDSKNTKIMVNCKYNEEFNKFYPVSLSNKKKPDNFQDIIYLTNEKNKI